MNQIKQLAKYFDQELHIHLPISELPDKSLVYNNYLVRQIKNNNWALYHLTTHELLDEFYLKSCALISAKYYATNQLNKTFDIKHLDRRYSSNHNKSTIFKAHLKSTNDYEHYLTLLNRYDYCFGQAEYFKQCITAVFKTTFAEKVNK